MLFNATGLLIGIIGVYVDDFIVAGSEFDEDWLAAKQNGSLQVGQLENQAVQTLRSGVRAEEGLLDQLVADSVRGRVGHVQPST